MTKCPNCKAESISYQMRWKMRHTWVLCSCCGTGVRLSTISYGVIAGIVSVGFFPLLVIWIGFEIFPVISTLIVFSVTIELIHWLLSPAVAKKEA